MRHRRNNVVALGPNWHLDLVDRDDNSPKLKQALHSAESRDAVRIAKRRIARIPSVGWSDPSEKLYTLEQVASHFQVDIETIRRSEKRGEIIAEPCGKNGKVLRFSRTAIDAYKTFLTMKRYG